MVVSMYTVGFIKPVYRNVRKAATCGPGRGAIPVSLLQLLDTTAQQLGKLYAQRYVTAETRAAAK